MSALHSQAQLKFHASIQNRPVRCAGPKNATQIVLRIWQFNVYVKSQFNAIHGSQKDRPIYFIPAKWAFKN